MSFIIRTICVYFPPSDDKEPDQWFGSGGAHVVNITLQGQPWSDKLTFQTLLIMKSIHEILIIVRKTYTKERFFGKKMYGICIAIIYSYDSISHYENVNIINIHGMPQPRCPIPTD